MTTAGVYYTVCLVQRQYGTMRIKWPAATRLRIRGPLPLIPDPAWRGAGIDATPVPDRSHHRLSIREDPPIAAYPSRLVRLFPGPLQAEDSSDSGWPCLAAPGQSFYASWLPTNHSLFPIARARGLQHRALQCDPGARRLREADSPAESRKV